MARKNWILIIALLLGMAGHISAQAESQVEVELILDGFHQAAAEADFDAYVAAMTDDVVFLGTDGTERWQGQAFRDFVQPHFATGGGWAYTPVQRNITLATDGQSAWFDESLQNDGLGLCRGSGVLVKSAQGWKIAQYNLSVPVPNAIVGDVVADIAALHTAGGNASLPAVSAPDAGIDAYASEAAPSAVAAESVVKEPEEDPEPVPAKSANCSKKRFKTNRKAGC